MASFSLYPSVSLWFRKCVQTYYNCSKNRHISVFKLFGNAVELLMIMSGIFEEDNEICSIGMTMQPSNSVSSGKYPIIIGLIIYLTTCFYWTITEIAMYTLPFCNFLSYQQSTINFSYWIATRSRMYIFNTPISIVFLLI